LGRHVERPTICISKVCGINVFVMDHLKLGQLIVLQNNLRLFRVFGNPLVAWDDGNHAT